MSWDIDQEILKQANYVPLIQIFKCYGLKIDEHNRKICCPFKSHKNGRESTPSFNFYPDTNSFYCFGCKKGNRPVDFISEIDGINIYKAAQKIISLFGDSCIDIDFIDQQNYSEKLNILLDFATAIREFREKYNDIKSFEFIETICQYYDKFNEKHELTNEALQSISNQLIIKIKGYTIRD